MNPYPTLTAFLLKSRLLLVAPRYWTLVPHEKCRTGQVNGIETFRGRPIATNGILYAIENEVGRVMVCHSQWFIFDKPERAERAPRSPRSLTPHNKTA